MFIAFGAIIALCVVVPLLFAKIIHDVVKGAVEDSPKETK